MQITYNSKHNCENVCSYLLITQNNKHKKISIQVQKAKNMTVLVITHKLVSMKIEKETFQRHYKIKRGGGGRKNVWPNKSIIDKH